MAKDDGTVLHELQMLEKQLDRLTPSLEKFNTRVSSMEADVRNIREKIKELRDHDSDFYKFKEEANPKFTSIEKDIEALQKDMTELEEAISDIKGESNKSKKVWDGRLWKLFEILFAAFVAMYVTYQTMRQSDKAPKTNEPNKEIKEDVNP